jgi:N-acetylglucosaminyldiphosphoundecaprenol N-acetyl-beta-D-mannosaminyltransferase
MFAAPNLQHTTSSQYNRFPRAVDAARIPASVASFCGQPRRIFGLQIRDTTLDDAANWLIGRATASLSTNVAFVNAHSINVLNRDVPFANELARFHCIFADGIGLRLAGLAAGVKLKDNVNGTDLFPVLCATAAKENVGIYLLGAAPGVASATASNMTARHPGLKICGTASGYFENEDDEQRVIDSINASGAEVLLVAMGVPTQECWIARNRHRLRPSVLIGVGGLFDYFSGNIARAPLWMRKSGLEWTWRLSLEPKRLARRYLLGNAEFLLRLAAQRLLSPQLFEQVDDASFTAGVAAPH